MLRQVAPLLAAQRRLITGAMAAVLASAALELAPPFIIKRIVDDHLTAGRAEGLLMLGLLYYACAVSVQGLSAITNYVAGLAAQRTLHRLRVQLFAHLQRLPIRYFDTTPLGDVISRCTADIETVDTLFSSGIVSLLTDLVRLVSVVVAMVLLSPQLTLVSLLVAPVIVWVTEVFRVRVRDAERANRLAVGVLNAQLQEQLAGVEVIRAFGRESAFVARFRRALHAALRVFNRSALYSTFYAPTMNIVSALVVALLLGVGIAQPAAAWPISAGTLTAFVLLFRRLFAPITALGDEWQTVQSALAGLERIFQVLGLPADQGASEPGVQPVAPPLAAGAAIELADVSFGYFTGRPVLQRVSFAVRLGEHVAVVGRTGAGKSSLLHLIGGLYRAWSGAIRIMGTEPGSIAEDERRRIVGVVTQTDHLFSGVLLDNLTLGDARVTRAAVERAASISGAAEFIRGLPQGYETPVSDGAGDGVQLSAGQRQLLALTRALIWDPPVLLLDEATARIDSVNEAAFRAALRADRQRGVLVVAHRLSTAREADRVLVMEGGRVIEEGAPDDLARSGGRFAALLELEAAGWDWRNNPT
jgi:ATP-binding cassette subfamily B protein